MRITGGSYGIGGKLVVQGDGIEIKGAVNKRLPADEIVRAEAKTAEERRFSISAFVLGAVVFGAAGAIAFGVFGAAIGLVTAVAAGFYTSKTLSVHVQLRDGTTVQADGWYYEIQKLTRLAAR